MLNDLNKDLGLQGGGFYRLQQYLHEKFHFKISVQGNLAIFRH